MTDITKEGLRKILMDKTFHELSEIRNSLFISKEELIDDILNHNLNIINSAIKNYGWDFNIVS